MKRGRRSQEGRKGEKKAWKEREKEMNKKHGLNYQEKKNNFSIELIFALFYSF